MAVPQLDLHPDPLVGGQLLQPFEQARLRDTVARAPRADVHELLEEASEGRVAPALLLATLPPIPHRAQLLECQRVSEQQVQRLPDVAVALARAELLVFEVEVTGLQQPLQPVDSLHGGGEVGDRAGYFEDEDHFRFGSLCRLGQSKATMVHRLLQASQPRFEPLTLPLLVGRA